MKIFKVTNTSVNLLGDHIWFYVVADKMQTVAAAYSNAKNIELISGDVIILHETTQSN